MRSGTHQVDALAIPLIRGRLFEPRDHVGAPRVIVMNETFAREHFPAPTSCDPLGV